ncbi:hypothetical protein FACS1894176_10490 [Bacteroidia bacterium]|nr:hypothetical protein FACS1894176_10490 [Bacteroidia bacterium]
MKIYHGTNIEFGAIDLNLCPPDRDFGQVFIVPISKKQFTIPIFLPNFQTKPQNFILKTGLKFMNY